VVSCEIKVVSRVANGADFAFWACSLLLAKSLVNGLLTYGLSVRNNNYNQNPIGDEISLKYYNQYHSKTKLLSNYFGTRLHNEKCSKFSH
jgi:hypothetical protein